jgi:hypothetical protein
MNTVLEADMVEARVRRLQMEEKKMMKRIEDTRRKADNMKKIH